MAKTNVLTLTQAIDAAGVPDELDEARLLALLHAVAGLDSETHPFAVGACEDALAAQGPAEPVLEIRPGGWVVHTTTSLARAALTSAVMTAVFYAGGFDQIPAYVLPAVLPLVIDVDQVRLSRGDRKLLALLRTNAAGAAGQPVNSDVLYNRLPAQVRQEVSPIDFADFVDKLVAAGEADNAGFGDATLRDRPRWIHITFD